ncbi:MAG: hypothetical protein ACK56F_09220, partial [bacterium]
MKLAPVHPEAGPAQKRQQKRGKGLVGAGEVGDPGMHGGKKLGVPNPGGYGSRQKQAAALGPGTVKAA